NRQREDCHRREMWGLKLGPQFALGGMDLRRRIVTRARKSLWLMTAAAICSIAALGGCKKVRTASGEVSRNWTPPAPDVVMDVSADDISAALTKRLADGAPRSVTADQWKHTKKLYTTFNKTLLWLDKNGVHQARVSALLNTIANADSDAMRLDDFPVVELN